MKKRAVGEPSSNAGLTGGVWKWSVVAHAVPRATGLVCGMVVLHGAAAAPPAPPPEPVVIASPADALAFHDAAPFVFSGQSLAVHQSFSTDRAIVLSQPAQLIVGTGTHLALGGVITSQAAPVAAPLEKLGQGTLALTGHNTYTSNTVLREGVLQVGGPSPVGAALYNLEQQRGTVLQLDPGTRLLNYIQVTEPRQGDMPLAGLEDEAQWRVASGSATLVNNVNALVPVRKTGEGSLRIADTVQSQSSLRVGEGALIVDGMVTGRVDVEVGARLEGGGALAGIHVLSGGTVAPGGRQAAATLMSWRDVRFDAGSLLHVNAYPDGRADLLDVLGVARLDGSVWAEAGTGEWAPETRYRILSAEGGLEGTVFEGVDANLAFLDPALEYDANTVYLTLTRNDLGVGDVGDTPDDKEVGDVIDPPTPDPDGSNPPSDPPGDNGANDQNDPPGGGGSENPPGPPGGDGADDPPGPPGGDDLKGPADPPGADDEQLPPDPPGDDDAGGYEGSPASVATDAPETAPGNSAPRVSDPLREAMLGMTRETARSALRQLTGSWHASVRSFVLEDSRHVREAVLAAGGALPLQARDTAVPHYGRAAASRARAGDGTGLRAWAHPYAAMGRRGAVGGVPGDRHDSQGVVLGLDAPAGRHWRLGGVFAGTQSTLRREGGQARAGIDSVHAGLTASGQGNGMRLTAGLLHAWHRLDSHRHVSAGRLNDLLSVSYAGRSVQAFVELAPALRSVGPFLRHAWVRLKLPAFQEAGGVAAHGVEAATGTMNATTLGWRLQHHLERSGGPVRFDTEIAWRHVWGDPQVRSTQRFGGGSTASATTTAHRQFTSQGLPLTRNAVLLGLGVSAAPARHLQVSARYSGLYGGAARSHAGWANLQWTF